MPKTRSSLSRRPTSRSRCKRITALKKALANKRSNGIAISMNDLPPNAQLTIEEDKELHQSDASGLVDLKKVWQNPNFLKVNICSASTSTVVNAINPAPVIDSNLDTSSFNTDNEFFERNPWGTDEDYERIMAEKLHVESVEPEVKIHGKRIVEIGYLLQRTLHIAEAHARSCTAGNLCIDKEIRNGLVSTIFYKCNMCDKTFSCSTEDFKSPTINTSVVWGTSSVGSTFKHTEEFLSTMDIPCISNTMFYTIQENLQKVWEESCWKNMQEAGKEERRIAIENGQVDTDGIPWISVYLDGGWSKRSYGHNYNALSGVAIIIGRATKSVLYLGVRNKFCIVCTRAENKKNEIPLHTCYKNWHGSSSGMEADIIVEGFCASEEIHGLRYKEFIADGDSNVYIKIQEKVPYGKEVTKIECANHVLKNYGKHLYNVKTDTKNVSIAARKLLTGNKIKELQTVASKAMYLNAHGNITTLIEDLQIGPLHVFGQHSSCKDYFCSEVGSNENSQMDAVKSSGLFRLIQGALSLVVRKANSLITNETNNRAELFMSILCRFNQGKRLNLIQRGSFKTRSELTAMRYNQGFSWHYSPWKRAVKRSPGTYMKKFINAQKKYKKKLVYPRQRQKSNQQLKNKNFEYGPLAKQPQLSSQQINEECLRFLETLVITKDEQLEVAKKTVGQFDNPFYITERANRLTASNFGLIINRHDHTSCHGHVKSILAPKKFSTNATEFGKINESVAIFLLEEELEVKVEASGFYIDMEYPFLGASPDGLVGDDALVEVKCLHKVAKLNISLEEAARTQNICLRYQNNTLRLKENHYYYFQIQGQLHITGRSLCYFVVFVNNSNFFIQHIRKDDDFWKKKMEFKLVRFYKECILPEIIRQNIMHGLQCVDPKYILDAKEEYQRLKNELIQRKLKRAVKRKAEQHISTKRGPTQKTTNLRGN